ncbi:hypothetical protein DMB65_18570 [Flavobacterium cheongpyeongense]|uniref:Uncharacterized protein n=1 Tax=Flavobacterium cheongpyeongense TaxID=2212651 RepID=A0A2V4BJW6_9FLAO|nr:hypothetical protein [Flavobacterium cheongpyeongense]PXY39255.1 hypothetical protein DMB65_18570 [Flavobacterium cheongpyeongense]
MKKIKIICLFLAVFSNNFIESQNLKPEYKKFIELFIENVKNNRIEAVADVITYPLKREYPVPEVKNKTEFLKRYNEIFDNILKNEIIKSNTANDWSEVGWRGIMLNQGTIWMDTNGKLTAINYQSKFEEELKKQIIGSEKITLHASITKFKKPECILETAKFRIRIDDLGNENYRYASWSIKKSMSEKPDLVLFDGKWFQDGTGGNHHFEFKKGQYVYECYITPLREKGAAPASLTIYLENKVILSQEAKIVPQ